MTDTRPDRDSEARDALAYLRALAMSLGYPHPPPLDGRDRAMIGRAAEALGRLMRDREGG